MSAFFRTSAKFLQQSQALAEMGVRVYCLALGGADLTSSAGTMTMNVLNAVAQFERDLLIERTQSGLKRAKSEGKSLGRPSTFDDKQKQDVLADLVEGRSISAIARKFVTSRQTIMRIRKQAANNHRKMNEK
nr:recombinase family protein [Pseudochrobactrum sp. AO18b]